MKALFTLKSAINHGSCLGSIALIAIAPMALPQLALAAQLQTFREPALVFQIKDQAKINSGQNQTSLSVQEIIDSDPLVSKVSQYLKDRGSPLDAYAPRIIIQPQWQRALAVSFVESNFGKYCFDNNCSGIGVKPGHPSWRKYQTKLDWFIDLNQSLETPLYKDRFNTFKKMKGVYVQPGSQAWVYGAQKVYNELTELTKLAEAERQELVLKANQSAVELPTFPELAALTK